MSLFDILFARNRGTIAGVGSVGFGSTYSMTPWSFQRIANSVLTNPTGGRAVAMVAENISRPNVLIVKPGTSEAIENSPLGALLQNPCPSVTGQVAMSQTMMMWRIGKDREVCGKSFWLKLRGKDGAGNKGPTTALKRMPPQRVTVIGNTDDELMGFVYKDRAGKIAAALPEDVLYLRYPHPERDYDGLAPALLAGLPAETDNAAARFNYDLLANDTALPGYITVEGLTTSGFRAWKAQWESGENPGKIRMLGGKGVNYTRVGQSNSELMYDKLRADAQHDIARAIGVPFLLLEPTDATYANMGEARSQLWQDKIAGSLGMIHDEMSSQFADEFPGQAVTFDRNEIEELNESSNSVVDRGLKMVGYQVITINEFRDDLGLDPVPWGDVPTVPLAPMKPVPVIAPTEEPTASGPTSEAGLDEEPSKVNDHELLPPKPPGKAIKARKAGMSPELFASRVATYEGRAERKMRAFLTRQGNVIAARIGARKGKSLAKAQADWFDKDRWDSELETEAEAIYADVIDAFGTWTGADLGGETFDPNASAVTKWIKSRSTGVAGLVNGTTEDDLRTVLAQAEADGLGIDGMVRQIRDYFEGSDSRAASRAETFSRTEVIGSASFATIQGAIQSGVATGKTWLTAGGGECSDCSALDGETVALGDSFSDGEDGPPDHPNCRCCVTIETADGTDEVGDGE